MPGKPNTAEAEVDQYRRLVRQNTDPQAPTKTGTTSTRR